MNEHNVVAAARIPAARAAHRFKSKPGVKEKAITTQERECLIATAASRRAKSLMIGSRRKRRLTGNLGATE